MASKKRGGLSAREYAAEAKKKAAPKLTRSVASKPPVATGPAVGPLMTGQVRANSGPAVGPLLTGQTRNETSTRELASRAQKKSSGGAQTLSGSSLLSTPKSKINIGSISGEGVSSGPNQNFTPAGGGSSKSLPGGGSAPKPGLMDRLFGDGSLLGSLPQYQMGNANRFGDVIKNSTPSAYAGTMEGFKEYSRDSNPGMSDNFESLTGGSLSQNEGMSDSGQLFSENNSPFSSANDTAESAGNRAERMYGQQPTSPTVSNSNKERNYSDKNDTADSSQSRYEDMYGAPEVPYQPTQEEITQQQNELYGGGSMTDTSSGTTGNRSGRGSGNFGTGKGVMSDDPYIKELRKAYSSNGGEKWLRKQFEELISALDPTYAQLQKEGTDALTQQLNTQNNQLASVMNANNTGDSEQRAQLMAQQQQGTQTAIGNLLAKLAQNKAQDVSGYRSQMSSALAQNADKQQTNRQRLMEQIQQYRNNQFDQQYKNASLAQKGSGDGDKEQIAKWGTDPITGERIYTYNEIDPLTGKKIMYDSEGQPFTN